MAAPYRSGVHAFRDRCAVTKFVLISTTNVAPADAEIKAGHCALWFDSTAGTPHLNFKAKDAAGTITTGQLG